MPIPVQVPTLGESVTQAVLLSWHKQEGQRVAEGEPLCELETDKANVDLPAPAAGVLHRSVKEGETVKVGDAIAQIDPAGVPTSAGAGTPAPSKQPASPPSTTGRPPSEAAPARGLTVAPAVLTAKPSPEEPGASRLERSGPAARRLVEENRLDPNNIPGSAKGGRITKDDVESVLQSRLVAEEQQVPPGQPVPPAPWSPPEPSPTQRIEPAPAPKTIPAPGFDEHGEKRVPMSKLRKRIAENLVRAQSTAAILTTFNEIDMSAVMDLRNKWKDQFEKTHGVGLGFMSFFARAVVMALEQYPSVNAFIDGDDILYHQHVHLGIAVSTERGLAVPVLKHAEGMSFAKIESEIKRLATATRDGKLSLEELSGGTFTITNGGVFGSLLSTPILNPPQSGILGMHTIQKRPVAIGDKIEIRPMMYVALSYDHRIVDGREAIGFLVRIKQLVEDPARMVLQV